MSFHDYVRRLPTWLVIAAAFALVAVIGLVDSVTGQEVSFAVFYLIPVMLVACVFGKAERATINLFSGATSLVADMIMNPDFSETWIPYWNALVRLGIFVVASELTAEISGRNKAMQNEISERTRVEERLRELNATLEQQVAQRTAAAEARSVQLAHSEAALQKQAEILESILRSMGEGVIVADAEGKILLSNPEAERMLRLEGATRFQDWLNRHQIYLPESLQDEQCCKEHPLVRALHGQIVDGAELFIAQHDSSPGIWMRTTARPLIDATGLTRGGVIMFNDMTARKRLEQQVAESSERERRRIGQDLHDGVCQHLVSASLASNMLAESLADKGLDESRLATEISNLIKEAIVEARSLAHALYPVDLKGEGLASTLEDLAETVQIATGLKCRFAIEGDGASIEDSRVSTNLFRIAQESVNNAVKHSHGSEILIRLSDAEGLITLTICDNGVGIKHGSAVRHGLGLDIMNYRARMIGASLNVRSSNAGTIVTCSLRCPSALIE